MRWLLFILAMAFAAPAYAEVVPVDSSRWQVIGDTARVEDYQGKHAIYIEHSGIALNDANFDTGVIEFDMAFPTAARGFPGIYFRGVDAHNYENFYFRPQWNGRPDATQYTPVFNDHTSWQIYSGPAYMGETTFPIGAWFHVKIEVAADSARFYINSDQPTLVIHDLKRQEAAGYVLLTGSAGTYYSNINITRGPQPDASPEPAFDLPDGLVRRWMVTDSMPEADAMTAAAANRLSNSTVLPVETNGILNIGRLGSLTETNTTVLAHFRIHAARDRAALMRFAFSDRVHIYLNGTLLYEGDDTQNSRDYRFLGIVGFWSSLNMQLRRGDNDIVFVVYEGQGGAAVGGGGWAAAAAFADMNGLSLDPRR